MECLKLYLEQRRLLWNLMLCMELQITAPPNSCQRMHMIKKNRAMILLCLQNVIMDSDSVLAYTCEY